MFSTTFPTLLQEMDNLQLSSEETVEWLREQFEVNGRSREDLLQMDPSRGKGGETVLHYYMHKDVAIALELIELGGKEIVWQRDDFGRTALHSACFYVFDELISKIIEVGGREIIFACDCYQDNALQIALQSTAPVYTIIKLIEEGGKDIVSATNSCGNNALHVAFLCEPLVLSTLIDVGGKDIIFSRNKFGLCPFLVACRYRAPIGIISKLIEIGGHEIAFHKDHDNKTALHLICLYYIHTEIEVASKLIALLGIEALREKDNFGKIPLHWCFYTHYESIVEDEENNNNEGNESNPQMDEEGRCNEDYEFRSNVFGYIVKQSILAEVGGEFGIGGIFNVAPLIVQQAIFALWDDFIPYVQPIVMDHQQKCPILHAAILANAPKVVIVDIINSFGYCISMKDSLNRLPIDVAVVSGLEWSRGMKEIIESTARILARPILSVAAYHGLQWTNHMKQLVESNLHNATQVCDRFTGLHLFMLAAAGERFDLSTIYSLIKMHPAIFDTYPVTDKNRKLSLT